VVPLPLRLCWRREVDPLAERWRREVDSLAERWRREVEPEEVQLLLQERVNVLGDVET
jgi:hypothetical protein